MKYRHNKKRNTAFLFETLVRELTAASAKGLKEKKNIILSIMKEHLNSRTVLGRELSLYKALYKENSLTRNIAEKLIIETKKQFDILDKRQIFDNQSALIEDINKRLGENIYNNFVPDYKELATINQLFYGKVRPKDQVFLEEGIVDKLASTEEQKNEARTKPLDKLALKTFFKKFNEEYSDSLLKEQQNLLSHFIASFNDNGLEFKIFLNEEIGRLKQVINEDAFFDSDDSKKEKKNQIMRVLENYKSKEIDSAMVKQVLSIQQLVCEIKS